MSGKMPIPHPLLKQAKAEYARFAVSVPSEHRCPQISMSLVRRGNQASRASWMANHLGVLG